MKRNKRTDNYKVADSTQTGLCTITLNRPRKPDEYLNFEWLRELSTIGNKLEILWKNKQLRITQRVSLFAIKPADFDNKIVDQWSCWYTIEAMNSVSPIY